MHAVSFEAAVSFFHNAQPKACWHLLSPFPPTDPDPALPRVMYVLVGGYSAFSGKCLCFICIHLYVQVGGDGLFQEIMNGLLDLRAQGGDMAAVAASMRLGHIPAGSTDAVAYSINGTRSQLTAALHIALGDRSADNIVESACPPFPSY